MAGKTGLTGSFTEKEEEDMNRKIKCFSTVSLVNKLKY